MRMCPWVPGDRLAERYLRHGMTATHGIAVIGSQLFCPEIVVNATAEALQTVWQGFSFWRYSSGRGPTSNWVTTSQPSSAANRPL
jgi:hypothetical protein